MNILPHELPSSHWHKVAKRNGIGYSTYYRRHAVYGWSKHKAATMPPLTPQQARAKRGSVK